MIYDSVPWKIELSRMLKRCEKEFINLGRLDHLDFKTDAYRFFQIEKSVFLGSFIIRKLMESEKLSYQVETSNAEITTYPIRDPRLMPDWSNFENVAEFYDVDAGRKQTIELRHLVNWIIHSHVFVPEIDSDHAGSTTIDGFYVNSDKKRGKEIAKISWAEFRRIINAVSHDDVVSQFWFRDGLGQGIRLRSSKEISREEVDAFKLKHKSFIEELWQRNAEYWDGE